MTLLGQTSSSTQQFVELSWQISGAMESLLEKVSGET
jgi:hypothetical protein